MKTSTICFAFLILVAARAMAQDTTCATFDTETVACNDPPLFFARIRRRRHCR